MVQDFQKLREECLSTGTLFEDPEFPADDSSLYFSKRPDRYIEWKRPMVRNFMYTYNIHITYIHNMQNSNKISREKKKKKEKERQKKREKLFYNSLLNYKISI